MQTAKRPRLTPSRWAHRLGPIVPRPGNIRGTVSWLHAGYHAKLAKARNIFGCWALDVNQLMARIAWAVGGTRLRDGIQRGADAAVAGCVGECLKAALIQPVHQI